MYPWIWRHLPGPLAARLVQALLLVGAAVALLLLVVFPAVSPHLPFNKVIVDSTGATPTPAAPDGP